MKILFLHGWHSVPGGVKPTYLAEHGHEVINPALDDDDFDAAVAAAQAEFDKHQPQVVVGSSRGGAVAMNIESGDARLVLLCPAWKRWGTATTVRPGTVILHSQSDDVIPCSDSEQLIRNSGLPAWTLIEIGSDHRLADPESLEVMLEACLLADDNDDEDEDVEPVQEESEDIFERDWTGHCFTAALQWASEIENREWLVVHGTVLSEKVGKRIEHAWCELEDLVLDLAMPVQARIVDRELYYQIMQPEVSKKYSSDDAMLLALKNRHDGPWHESEQLKE